MKILTTYSVKIKETEYNKVLVDTVIKYRQAVDYLIDVVLKEWNNVIIIEGDKLRQRFIETLIVGTHTSAAKYDFTSIFYKFPCYLRRAAISESLGKVSSYKSNYNNWLKDKKGKKPGYPAAGYVYPALYRDNTYVRKDMYSAEIKVWIRNTWDWITVSLNKGDVDYILRNCSSRTECIPTIRKRGKKWYLDFAFKENVVLSDIIANNSIAVAVDLGINNACTCVAMLSDGTILGREFLKLPGEQDSLKHSLNRIKKAQQHGAKRMPRLWAKAKGINDDISTKTASFIIAFAEKYNANVIVFEHLDINGKKRGSKKQRLHMWRSAYVQSMVADKAHRLGMRISHICAKNTSRLAYDGSGNVYRGKEAYLNSYSLCKFKNGKTYNCDLNAAYNIGARYYIREILRMKPETARLDIEAKVPQCSKRSTCTLSTLISLNAVISA